MMKCTWDAPQSVELGKTVKNMHVRIFEDSQSQKSPIYVCEYNQQDTWTAEEKGRATEAMAGHLKHGSVEDVRCWEMNAKGEIKELSFKKISYTTRPDRLDLSESDFEAAEKAGELRREQNTSWTTRETPISEPQQRAALGQVLLSHEQRQEFDPSRNFAAMKGPSHDF